MDTMAHLVGTQRRLAAILVADMVGYSRLMEQYEEYTFSWQRRLRLEVLDPGIAASCGRLVKNTGDGFVAIFDSAGAATRCALSLQQTVANETREEPVERRVMFRMAVNLAEIIVEEDDVYGDGVNVAARLQVYAEPGGVIVSGIVAEQVGSSLGVSLTDLGELPLRNRVSTVQVFALAGRDPAPGPAAGLVADVPTGAELPLTTLSQPQMLATYDLVVQTLDHLYRTNYASFCQARGLLQQVMPHDSVDLPPDAWVRFGQSGRIGDTVAAPLLGGHRAPDGGDSVSRHQRPGTSPRHTSPTVRQHTLISAAC
jgi:class 3 adenylate cyclase